MKINPFIDLKEWLKQNGKSQEKKGFPVSVLILVSRFHPT